MESSQIPRKDSICHHTIQDSEPLELNDLDQNEFFANKSYVIGDPNLRYYFGVPIRTKEGTNIGALCVMDQQNHSFSPEKIEMFKIIADEVISRLEHRKLIKELRNKLDEADQLNRKVSHDIRGPIGGIIGLSQIIKENASDNDISNIIEMIEMINKGGKTVLELADEILSSNPNGKTQNKYKLETITISDLKSKIIDLYKPQAQLKNIDFSVKINIEHAALKFPKMKLLQIFGNMISNAVKFTNENGEILITLDKEDVTRNSALLLFTIKDNGVGMSKEQIDAMLNDSATSTPGTNDERGFGFGFQLSHHLIKSMNGSMDIKSEAKQGTEIMIKLPVKIVSDQDALN